MLRAIVLLIFDALFAIPRVAYNLALYFWIRVGNASDPEAARQRAVFWTWITLLGVAAIVVLAAVLASAVQW